MNPIEWMMENKIAANTIQARNIFAGLELDKVSVSCSGEGCQEGHYALGYQEYENGEGEVVWGACPCCDGKNYKACPKCSDEARIARILLYRKWRPKTDKKNQLPTWQAFELAIAGIDPADVVERQIEMEMG